MRWKRWVDGRLGKIGSTRFSSVSKNIDFATLATVPLVCLEPRTRFELVTLACLIGLPRQCSWLVVHLPG